MRAHAISNTCTLDTHHLLSSFIAKQQQPIPTHAISFNPSYLGVTLIEVDWSKKVRDQLYSWMHGISYLDLTPSRRVLATHLYI
ncbi:hypothetical protein DAMA08_017320 [Martiniozyma asiatica (nom. inval.)]|nr:hypothetical protein DAMA08_017320 [Martiniozyma asiatica]